MRWINPPIKAVASLCGHQTERADCEYRLSRYCVATPNEGGQLLYHTLTGALAQVPPGGYAEEERKELIEHWFLVPEGFDEHGMADGIRRIAGMMKPSAGIKTDFTILTTTDCNARCFYCYELGIRRIPMAQETAAEAAKYIIRSSRGNPVKLRWFGGEPLYNREAIDTICDSLAENGTAFESSMVTNGFYLDAGTARQAVDAWHLKKVQITIDGTEEMYNRTKAYIDAEANPYQRVMNNIQSALDAGIRVTIRLNMDARNAQNLLELVDDVAERFPDKDGLDMYVELLHAFAGGIHAHQSQEQAQNDYEAIKRNITASGLMKKTELPRSLRIGHCMADNDQSEVILPDGRVGRCEHFSKKMITGHIRDDIRDRAVEAMWKAKLSVPECENCPFYPQCTKLKECEWNKEGCPEIERNIRMQELKEQMLRIYKDYLNGDGEQ